MEMDRENKLIFTDRGLCAGCNKCIVKCPVDANDAYLEDGKNKIIINHDRCIHCGECIRVCDHKARYYVDDTARFFEDLEAGAEISVIAAPAIRHSAGDYQKLFGFLKSRGVKAIYDVSFGADITTWAYLKAVKERGLSSVIAQPCPVVVSYVQMYKPELLQDLAPVHSPAMCQAIYLRKYKNLDEKIAFLSPCIAKSVEFQDENTYGYIDYNVTIEKLLEYISSNGISLSKFTASNYDDENCGLGLTYSRPGGLRENVEQCVGHDNVWIRQVEGIHEVCAYFDEYEERRRSRKSVPLLVDVLNCSHGCNLGTAAPSHTQLDQVDQEMNRLKNQKLEKGPSEESLLALFDRTLSLDDFLRGYTAQESVLAEVSEEDIQGVFHSLGKGTKELQEINCYACGYGSCMRFAKAVASGHNHIENCIYYARNQLNASRGEFDEYLARINQVANTVSHSLEQFTKDFNTMEGVYKNTKIIAVNASIEAAHAGASGLAFKVVAQEVKDLAEHSNQIVDRMQKAHKNMMDEVGSMRKSLDDMEEHMHSIME